MFLTIISFLPLELEMGLLAGFAVASSGYIQAYSRMDEKGNREKFNVDKFFTTIVIGGAVGLGLAFVGSFENTMNLFLINAGIVAIVGSLIKAILRIH
ncbi:MAG: hypothetical protein PHP82_03730 [Candidatus ainarchaeum sp.]|nr:hypothetical protein [Candidatus ainarchaeum sp.]